MHPHFTPSRRQLLAAVPGMALFGISPALRLKTGRSLILQNIQNQTIEDLVITGGENCISIWNAVNCTICNCRVSGATGEGGNGNGILLVNCRNCTVEGNWATGNRNGGIQLASWGQQPGNLRNIVVNNHLDGNAVGLSIDDGWECVLSANRILNSSYAGMLLYGGGHIVNANRIRASIRGLVLSGAQRVAVTGNGFQGNSLIDLQALGGATYVEAGNVWS